MRLARTKLIGGALVLAGALALAGVGLARQDGHRGGFGGPPPGGPGRGPGGRGGDVLGPFGRDLNLTDAQKAQIKQLTDAFEESTKSLREQMFKAGGTPFDGLDGAFDEAAVRAAAQARASAQVELDVARAKLQSQVYALLTAEQKAKVAELRQQFSQGRHEPRRGSEF
jgi:protein CpxP